jgi:hypothetical protein
MERPMTGFLLSGFCKALACPGWHFLVSLRLFTPFFFRAYANQNCFCPDGSS